MTNKIKLTKKVSQFIREKRIAMGLSQKDFAERVFGDPSESNRIFIVNIEKGKSITLKTLEIILENINADIEFIEY